MCVIILMLILLCWIFSFRDVSLQLCEEMQGYFLCVHLMSANLGLQTMPSKENNNIVICDSLQTLYPLVTFGLEMLMRIQAVLSPVGWGTCNSLCSQSALHLSLTDCFYLFLYPLSLCLAPEQTAHYSLLCSANTKFQTLPSSFCSRQQTQFFSTVLAASNTPSCPAVTVRLDRANSKEKNFQWGEETGCLPSLGVYVFHKCLSLCLVSGGTAFM